jgi:hypothetical protein
MPRLTTDQIELARDHDLLELARGVYGVHLKRIGAGEYASACPTCGGRDRFAINANKRVFNCRGCGIKGKNAIDLVMQIDDCAFADAVQRLTGGAWTPAAPKQPVPIAAPAAPAAPADDNLERAAFGMNRRGIPESARF